MRDRVVIVDILTKKFKSVFYKQYDDNNELNIVVYEGKTLANLSNYVASVYFELPSGKVYEIEGTIENNTIKVMLSSSILEECGQVNVECELSNLDKIVTTFTFYLNVEKSINKVGALDPNMQHKHLNLDVLNQITQEMVDSIGLSGGLVDLSIYQTKRDTTLETDNKTISGAINELNEKVGNAIGTGVTVSTTSGETSYTLPTASSTTLGGIKVGDRLSIDSNGVLSADVQESTPSTPSTPSNELILTSPSGYRFKVIVNDEGVLSTEEIVTLGNIIASVSELSINEGESATFTISLSETPTRAQTISIVSDNTDVTVNPSSIAISDTNPHTITVLVAEDEDYADETATLTLSSPKVSNVTINVAIKDNDVEPKPCTGIALDQTSLSLTKGKTKQLVATAKPRPENNI